MASFANVSEAVAFVKSIPAATEPDSAFAGIDVQRLSECVDMGLLKLDEFKLAAAKVAAGTAAAKSAKIDWTAITESSLPPAAVKLLAQKREADQAAKKIRLAFESEVEKYMISKGKTLPTGKRWAHGFNFGRYSLGIADVAKSSGSKGSKSLDDLLN